VPTPEPRFFDTPADFRAWLEEHHDTESELFVGFWKKASGRPSISWREAVDEALCFGWIDGVARGMGADAWAVRFTPRRPRSNWSAVNVARVEELMRDGRMRPAGIAAFERRDKTRAPAYAHEREAARFTPEQERALRANSAAWEFFSSQPPSYRRSATHWVTSAKREETRARRMATLIGDSAAGRRVPPLRRPS
jgi:uncharacterized protein YdeI (YjbR/CyaY-like superfamily)